MRLWPGKKSDTDSTITEAQISAQLYREYKCSARDFWLANITTAMKFYLGEQWTQAELDILAERGQADIVINRIFPIVQQKLAQLSAHRATIRTLPVEGGDNKKALLWNMMIDYVLQQSHFDLVETQMKRDHIVKGLGYYFAYIDPFADDGRGEVKVRSLKPELVFVDPNSQEPDFSDADNILISRKMTVRQAANMFPNKEDKIVDAAGEILDDDEPQAAQTSVDQRALNRGKDSHLTSTVDTKYTQPVRTIKRFTRVQILHHLVTSVELQEQDVVDHKTYLQVYKDDPRYEAADVYRLYVRRIVSAGENVELAKEIQPVRHYPVVPSPNIFLETPFPMGDVGNLIGMQREKNKRRSIQIHSANHASTPKILYEEGTINEEIWDEEMHKVGGRLPYQLGATGNPPIIIQGLSLPNAFFTQEGQLDHDMDFSAGVFPMSHGDTSQAPETLGATLAMEEYSNRRLQPNVDMLGHAKKVLGEVIIDLCQDHYTLPKYVRVVGDEGGEEMWVNSGEDHLDRESRYDVVVEGGRFAPTNRMATQQIAARLHEIGLLDKVSAVELTDLPNKDKIIERIDEISQLQGALQQMQEKIEDLEGINQTLQREVAQQQIKSTTDEYRNLEKKELLETKAAEQLFREQLNMALKAFRGELNLALKEAKQTGRNSGEPEKPNSEKAKK